MKSLRKTFREHRLKTHDLLRTWLQPKFGAIGIKYRIAARIRLANVWARRHPRRTFACVTGSLLLLLVGDIAMASMKHDVPDSTGETGMTAIANMEPLFSGFRAIQENKTLHRNTLAELTAKGVIVRNELDSMIAIPHKTRSDSIHIVMKYRQLEGIVKSLKNNDNP